MKYTNEFKLAFLLVTILLLIFLLGRNLYLKQIQFETDTFTNEVHHEIGMLSQLVEDSLQKRDYQLASKIINHWAEDSIDLVEIVLVADNGFELARYQSKDLPEKTFDTDLEILYSLDSSAKLSIVKSIDGLSERSANYFKNGTIIFVFLSVIIIFLFYTIWRIQNQKITLLEENKQRKLVEGRLKEAQQVAHLGSWSLNLKTGIARWSDEMYRILGYEPNEVEAVPDNLFERIHKDDREYASKELDKPFKQKGKEYQAEFRLELPNGEIRVVNERGRLIYAEDGQPEYYSGTTLDVTERKQQEEQILRGQKMDALGKLTSGIAHDYNNMLGVIIGYADLLQDGVVGDPKLERYVSEIHKSSERGAKLTKKLLAFSSKKPSVENKVDINSIINDERHLLETTLTASIKLAVDAEDGLWTVCLDDNELRDSLLNLCINAKHAMDGKGALTLQTRNVEIDENQANALQIDVGSYVKLNVIDTGCGMDQETIERIFEPFYTTKGVDGTGLGLYQVYGFIERCRGTIRIYSEKGHGAQFTLYFPKHHDGTFIEEMNNKENSDNAYSGNETILVVDDEPALLFMVSEVLSKQGYEVITTDNVDEGLYVLESNPIDLLITDIIMPVMDGYQFSAFVHEKFPDLKIQLASGFSDERHSDMVEEELQKNLLHKPFHAKTLLKRVRELLDS